MLSRMKESDRVLVAMYAQAYGSPPQTMAVSGAEGGPLEITVKYADG